MKRVKLNLSNDNLEWNADRRYKINAIVSYLGVNYQNITGINSLPTSGVDWQIVDSFIITTVTDILSSALATQTSAGMATWINANSFAVATNEIRQFHVTDTGQVFELLLRGRNFGNATPAISYIDVLDYGNPIKSVRQINSATTLANSDVGLVIILTGSCTVTIPNGLMANFECTLVTLAGATLTLALGGSVTLLNNTGTTMAEKLSFTLKNTLTANQYLTVGNL